MKARHAAWWNRLPPDYQEAINKERVERGLPPHPVPAPVELSPHQARAASQAHSPDCDCALCIPENSI